MLQIVERLLEGDRRSLARAISIIDNDDPDSQEIVREIFPLTGKSRSIGFTGPAGAGKSSLIGVLVQRFQTMGYRTAILAVDPTSPITGGAILGDRVRMQATMDNSDVFMRSLASRGAVGGVSNSLRNVMRILDVAGFDLILVESVGAGQVEVEISRVVDMTIVVLTPQTGDNIQSIKAGLNEIGEIYVINKGDLEGAGNLFDSILEFVGETEKKPSVLKVSARTGYGVEDLALRINEKLISNKESITEKRKSMLKNELQEMIFRKVEQRTRSFLKDNLEYDNYVSMVIAKKIDPYLAAERISAIVVR
ncbi:MAG TPA: methylmalonyl Co-A mutase-associated GTPase MeaB [Nitrososphaeraceae archaeon]|jgi:LAO/AO transport system kinase|nr:methylmalonyl Co-A mutase-associated GTPase MeaB [Nitrososphaeraceae archaeon]